MLANQNKNIALIIVRYPAWSIPFALLSMAFFRIPLYYNKRITFWKLLGCGKNGTFDLEPDWRQWGLLLVSDDDPTAGNSAWNDAVYSPGLPDKNKNEPDNIILSFTGKLIMNWWRLCKCKKQIWVIEPAEGHGKWDGKEPFGPLPAMSDHDGKTAVLTRATIRFSRLRNFWKNVEAVAARMKNSKGFIQSVGIGEFPFLRQATFSIWESRRHMLDFAYKLPEHKRVIQKTRKEEWYSEEMFVRFRILYSGGFLEKGLPNGQQAVA